jgi:phage terminase large subunit
MAQIIEKNIATLIGGGYRDFWNFKGRYRAVKGGRGSKKSTTASFWFPYNMMKYWHSYGLRPNVLVIRRYFNTHRQSTFAQLKWAINQLGVAHLWKCTVSPLEMTYLPSGQKIMFRGIDDPQSITSITVEEGHLCWVWWEEAFQVTNEKDFDMVDMSIRGDMPAPLFKQHTVTMNPWSDKIWIKPKFFDVRGDSNILALTMNYDCNEFLGDDDRKLFEDMKKNNPRRYSIEGEGNWGISEGLIYINWQELEFDYNQMMYLIDGYGKPVYRELYGMDFGYTNDPTAFTALLVNERKRELFIFDEIYRTHMKNKDIYDTVKYKGLHKKRICADSEDPKSIDELRDLGLGRIYGAKKGKGSVKAGIQKLQDYKIYVHPRCENTIVEMSNYVWATDKQTGKPTTEPAGEYNHLMDALRYATEDLNRSNFSW